MRRYMPSTATRLLTFGASAAVYLLSTSPIAAQTKTWSGVCVGNTVASKDVATLQGFECLIGNIFTIILTLIGLAGFVMLIIASFRYLLSGGNTKGTETARNTFYFVVIGIVVALSGFIILNLLSAFTGIKDITIFSIPKSTP